MVISNIGAEIEYNLIDSQGYLINNAPRVLADPRNDGSLVKEGTNSQIEIVSCYESVNYLSVFGAGLAF